MATGRMDKISGNEETKTLGYDS